MVDWAALWVLFMWSVIYRHVELWRASEARVSKPVIGVVVVIVI